MRVGRPAAITRGDVLRAGLETGMADLTIAAVAERLGVTRTSVHRHVGSRHDLETLVGEHLVVTAPFPEDRGQPLEAYLLEFARLHVRHMLAHPGLAAYYNRGFPRTTASARVVEDFDAMLVARGLTRCAGGAARHLRRGAGEPDRRRDAAELRADLTASPLYAALPAARAGHVLEVSEQLATANDNPSILNVPWQLEQFRPTLEKVAAG